MSSGQNVNVDCSYILCPKVSDIQACNSVLYLSGVFASIFIIGSSVIALKNIKIGADGTLCIFIVV